MKIAIFAWMPREKPPFFGGMPTWNYVKKLRLNNWNEKRIKNILGELSKDFETDYFKVIVYNGWQHRNIYYRLNEVMEYW